MRIFCFVVFILAVFITKAQPGGGGGLKIYSIYDINLNKLSIRKNEVKVRAFGIEATYGDESSQVSHEIELKKSDTILLAPVSNLNFYYNSQTILCLRLLFIYKGDTSIVDFNNVIGGNGAGWVMQYDSLIINHGYKSYNYTTYDSVIVKQKDKIDLSFLNEEKLTQSYYCSKAQDAMGLNNYEVAIKYLLIAEGKKNKFGIVEKRFLPEIKHRLAECYYNVSDYEKAELKINEAINLTSNDYEYYKTLTKILIKQNKLTKASTAYDQAFRNVRNSEYYNYEETIRYDWALFNIRETHSYDTVINVYKKLVEPFEKTYYYPVNKESFRGNYEDYYFMLGLAEHAKGDLTTAYNHWLTALELGYGNVYYYASEAHFDSILKRHTNEAMPNLLYAIALYKASGHKGSDESLSLNKALNNIENAQKGLNTTSLYYWKAQILFGLKKHSESLEEINTAISMDKKNPKLYDFRASIWRELGFIDYDSRAKQDYKTFEKLLCANKYEELNIKSFIPNDFSRILFTIVDYPSYQLYPSKLDTIGLAYNSQGILNKPIEKQTLHQNLVVTSIYPNSKNEHRTIYAEAYHKKYSDVELFYEEKNGLVFGYYHNNLNGATSKTISIKRGKEEMLLKINGFNYNHNFDAILLDSIPFKNGVVEVNIEKILMVNKLMPELWQNKSEQEKRYYDQLRVKPKLIRKNQQKLINMENCINAESFFNHWSNTLIHTAIKNNDTTYYYYCDSLSNLFCKGVYKKFRTVWKRGKIYITDPGFDTPPRRKIYKSQHRYGEWKYYDINGNILLESHYKKEKVFALKNNKTVPTGTWKYYDNGTLIMKEIYKSKSRVEVIRY